MFMRLLFLVNPTVGRRDETCEAGRGLHVHEVTVFVNPQWEGGMRHARLANRISHECGYQIRVQIKGHKKIIRSRAKLRVTKILRFVERAHNIKQQTIN